MCKMFSYYNFDLRIKILFEEMKALYRSHFSFLFCFVFQSFLHWSRLQHPEEHGEDFLRSDWFGKHQPLLKQTWFNERPLVGRWGSSPLLLRIILRGKSHILCLWFFLNRKKTEFKGKLFAIFKKTIWLLENEILLNDNHCVYVFTFKYYTYLEKEKWRVLVN